MAITPVSFVLLLMLAAVLGGMFSPHKYRKHAAISLAIVCVIGIVITMTIQLMDSAGPMELADWTAMQGRGPDATDLLIWCLPMIGLLGGQLVRRLLQSMVSRRSISVR